MSILSIRRAPQDQVARFKADVALLISVNKWTANYIGAQIPNLGGANFIKYYTEIFTITPAFLAKFYKRWAVELSQPKYRMTGDPVIGPITDGGTPFGNEKKGEKKSGNETETIWESNLILARTNEIAAKANVMTAEANRLSAEANSKTSETNQLLAELLLRKGNGPAAN